MNKDTYDKYNQPFCIIGGKGQFATCYQARRYLPPLQYIEAEEKPPQDVEIQQVIEHRIIKTHDRQLTRKVNDNTNAIKYLLEKEKQKGGKKYQGSYF